MDFEVGDASHRSLFLMYKTGVRTDACIHFYLALVMSK
jgi:hypothetical protein